jgi:hypothetical protein
MFNADNSQQKIYVITYKELVFTFIVFVVILFVLYPKDLLKDQILSEKSNYDLSMLYLKNLLKHNPEDESLMLILAEQSLRTGKKDLSLRLLGLLLKSKNIEHRQRATLLSYELEKDNYFYIKDKEQRKKQLKKLRTLYDNIFYQKMYKEEDSDFWYKESLFVKNDIATYYFLVEKLKKDPKNVKFLEKAYYLSIDLDIPKDSRKYIQLLAKYDSKNKDKWALSEYYMYINNKEYKLAKELLVSKKDISLQWYERLGDFYLMRKQYKTASKIYLDIMKSQKDYKLQKRYFYKTVNALQAGSFLDDAVKIVKQYEKKFIDDIDVRTFMLKVYIAANKLDDATALSQTILEKELKL